MNKIYLFTAAFAVMASLSGCSDTELASIDTAQEKTPIGFHTVGSQMGSRATIINSGDITKTDFKVYAFDGEGNAFMGKNDTEEDVVAHNGVRIMYENNTWKYANEADIRYWPENTPLDFYAVNPGSVAEEELKGYYNWKINKETQQITYTSFDEYKANTAHKNMDVMYAIAKNKTKDANNGKVNLAFKHILSQIVFQAKTQYKGMQVDIKDIKIHNFMLSGTFTFPATADASPALKDWQTPANAKAIGVCTVVKDQTITVKSAAKPTDISSQTPLLLVPQELNKPWNTKTTPKTVAEADKDNESYLEINCRIQQNGTCLFDKDGFKTLYVPFSASWEPGKRYVYTLIFGGGYDDQGKPILIPIKFEPSVEDWPTDENSKKSDIDL